MKKILLVVLVCFFSLGFTQAAFADLESDATAHVWVDVVANVAVSIADANVDLGDIQMGELNSIITFRVDANLENVNLHPFVSNLYKGDDPLNADVDPILVDTSKGVTMTPELGGPTAGADNLAEGPVGVTIDTFPGFEFEQINFESSQDGHFSQNVALEAHWLQDDPEKTMGEYSGIVKLYCLLTP